MDFLSSLFLIWLLKFDKLRKADRNLVTEKKILSYPKKILHIFIIYFYGQIFLWPEQNTNYFPIFCPKEFPKVSGIAATAAAAAKAAPAAFVAAHATSPQMPSV